MIHFFRLICGLSPDAPVWDLTTFTKNHDRLQNGDVFAKFMAKLLNHSEVKPLLSDKHPDPRCPQRTCPSWIGSKATSHNHCPEGLVHAAPSITVAFVAKL